MRLERFPSPQALAREAARRLAERCRGRASTLLLPAGGTPVGLYRELVAAAREGSFDPRTVTAFQLDEVVGRAPEHRASFQGLLREQLLARLVPGPRAVHLLDGGAPDPQREIERHGRELLASGGADLALLGLGRNGHVAFNEPGSPAGSGARVVALAPETREALGMPPGGEPAHGMTLGLRDLRAARAVWLLVVGAAKAGVLRRVLTEPPREALPASLLRSHPHLVVLADEDACAELGGGALEAPPGQRERGASETRTRSGSEAESP